MLGWHVSVYRQADGGHAPATSGSGRGDRLAVWQAGRGGLDWIRDRAAHHQAVALGGDGYPLRYTGRACWVIPVITAGPPHAHARWHRGPDDVVSGAWDGRTVIDAGVIAACRDDEWLLIEAWDES